MLPGTENKGCDVQAGFGRRWKRAGPWPGTPLLWLVLPEPGQRLVCVGSELWPWVWTACDSLTTVYQLLLYFLVPVSLSTKWR